MVYFCDFFKLPKEILEDYGAFNISLINDLPLFIDPFLLFGSSKQEYKEIHNNILKYLSFLKSKSEGGGITEAEIASWYKFSEVKQNWLGYSVSGNGGSGLGDDFGRALSKNMHVVFNDLYNETVTITSHLEKAGLFQIGIGKDNISDFTCNLIKSFLLSYTEKFAKDNLDDKQVKTIMVNKVHFNYEFERWMPGQFTLPFYNNDYVILTPKDILTKDDNWINSHDLKGDFPAICSSIPNSQLRSEIHNYFQSKLPAPTIIGKGRNKREKKPSQSDISKAINQTIQMYPLILDYYIKRKEENKEGAKNVSEEKVQEVEEIFNRNVSELISELIASTTFYELSPISEYKEALKRVEFLKDVIENKDGYKLFYYKGEPIKKEADLQVIYRLIWFSSPYEVNDGRKGVSYSNSKGTKERTSVDFKLASNSKLRMNLESQVKVNEDASDTKQSIKVIMFFSADEYVKVHAIMKELKLDNDKSIVLIDAGDNKPSASNVT